MTLLIAGAAIGVVTSFSASAVAAIRGCFNGRIAFDSARNGSRDIYLTGAPAQGLSVPTPTSTPTRLTTGPDDAQPSWSPPDPHNTCNLNSGRATLIAFQRTSGGQTNIYRIDASTPEPSGHAIQVTNGGADTAPAWAYVTPAGAPSLPYPPIAFERSINGHRDIFVANYDGSDPTNLTNSSGADYANPDWASENLGDSPKLTFDSDQGGRREIWVMDVGFDATQNRFVSSNMRQVTIGQPVSSQPSWFSFNAGPPSGDTTIITDRIAFAGPDQDGGPSQIDIAEYNRQTPNSTGPFTVPAGTNFFALTNDATGNSAPAWSADGQFIAYQKANADGNSDIYVLDTTTNDESGDVNLTQHVGDNRDPDWEAVEFVPVEVFPIRPVGRRHRTRRAEDIPSPAPAPSAHTLTAALNGPGEGSVTGPGISCPATCVVTYPDATVVPLRAVAAPGSTFAGWAGAGCSGAAGCTITISADVQVTATFDVLPLVPPTLSALHIFPPKFTLTGRLVRGRCLVPTSGNRKQHACTRAIALRISYMLTIPSRVSLTFQQELAGRLVKGHCIAVTHVDQTRRRCTRLLPMKGSLTRASVAGSSAFIFTGRIGGHRLQVGSYRLTATPSANGQTGDAQSATFE
ncbi:MAG: PD40 domain-containing protein, partial [Mycobacteriaceae bacterium]|nr:PD40 domain-containing protein [Mycobacteriaceae bacterium]